MCEKQFLAYCTLRFLVRFAGEGRLPSFPGTTVRGALGYALKKTVCVVRHRDCARCMLRRRCAFPVAFDGVPADDREFMRKYPHVPQPMLLRVGFFAKDRVQTGDLFEFGIRLFGPAIEAYPYVVFAVIRLGQDGLGPERVPFEVVHVDDGSRIILDGEDHASLLTPTPQHVSVHAESGPAETERIQIDLVTPVRLQTDGTFNRAPDFQALFRALVRRIRILTHFYGDSSALPDQLDDVFVSVEGAKQADSQLRRLSIPRFSRRQGMHMKLDGVLGRIACDLPDTRPLPWLRAAEACHVGKATSFGFGRIALKVLPR